MARTRTMRLRLDDAEAHITYRNHARVLGVRVWEYGDDGKKRKQVTIEFKLHCDAANLGEACLKLLTEERADVKNNIERVLKAGA